MVLGRRFDPSLKRPLEALAWSDQVDTMMTERTPIEIEMRPDGSFVDPPRLSLGQRLLRGALIIAALAGLVVLGFLFVGLALLLIPAALTAAGVAWAAFRYQIWRGRRG